MKMLLDSTFWTRQRVLALTAGCMLCLLLVIAQYLSISAATAPDGSPIQMPAGPSGVIEEAFVLIGIIGGITAAMVAAESLTPQNRPLIEIMATTRWTLARQAVRVLLMAVAGTATAFSAAALPLVTFRLAAEGPRPVEAGHEALLFAGGLLNVLIAVWVFSSAALIGTLSARSSTVGAALGALAVLLVTMAGATVPPSPGQPLYLWLFDLSGLLHGPAQWVLVRLLYAGAAGAALLFALNRLANPRFLLRPAALRTVRRATASQGRLLAATPVVPAWLRLRVRPGSALGAGLDRGEALLAQYGYLLVLELRELRLLMVHVLLVVVWLFIAQAESGTLPECLIPGCSMIRFWDSFGIAMTFLYPLLVAWISFDAIMLWRGSGLERLSLSITSAPRYFTQRVIFQISVTLIAFAITVFALSSVVSFRDIASDPLKWVIFLQAFAGMTLYGAGVAVLGVVSVSMAGASLAKDSWVLAAKLSICVLMAIAFAAPISVVPWSLRVVAQTTTEWMKNAMGAVTIFTGYGYSPLLSGGVLLAAVVLAVAFAGVMMWGGGCLYTRRVRSQ
jgi:hypothetical protein